MSVTSRRIAGGLLLVALAGCGTTATGGTASPATGGTGPSLSAAVAELPALAVQATIGGLDGVASMASTEGGPRSRAVETGRDQPPDGSPS
jgi:hypothetical protein